MGAMLAAGGLINGGAVSGMLRDTTHTQTLILSLFTHIHTLTLRTEGHTGGGVCVCLMVPCLSLAKQAGDRPSSDLLPLVTGHTLASACSGH